jgi:hypothetical protein
MTRVMDLISGDIVMVQDSQDRLAILEHIGLPHLFSKYPTLFAQVGEGEYLKVWGLDKVVPYLDYEVDLIWENK